MSSLRLLALFALLAACGDDSSEPLDDIDASVPAIDAAPPAALTATVSYAGEVEGSLVLAVFSSFPPSGGPAGFAQMPEPAFPATMSIAELPAGDHFVVAVLDAEPASPQQPGPEDRQTFAPITVVAGQTTTVELTLMDPR